MEGTTGNGGPDGRIGGYMNKVYRFWIALLGTVGGVSLAYFVFLVIMLGFYNKFNYVWLGLTCICGGLIVLVRHYAVRNKIPPKWVTIPVEVIVGISFLIFILTEAVIIHAGQSKPVKQADYLIVLGAKVNGTHPSLILRYRIDAATEYLKQNPGTMVVASGGKGNDEDISEAQCIYQELVDRGIDPGRIRLEETSVNTRENLMNSGNLLNPEQDTVVLTTTDFHLFRALRLAKKCGYQHISGNPAKSVWWLIPTNYTREFFAIIKELLCGNL